MESDLPTQQFLSTSLIRTVNLTASPVTNYMQHQYFPKNQHCFKKDRVLIYEHTFKAPLLKHNQYFDQKTLRPKC